MWLPPSPLQLLLLFLGPVISIVWQISWPTAVWALHMWGGQSGHWAPRP